MSPQRLFTDREGDTDAPARPRTMTVLGLLALTALTFSYLGSYAVYNALVVAKLADGWHGVDPRPRWLITSFCVLMLLFMAVGELFRRLSKSDFRAIDEMADAEDRQVDPLEPIR